MSYCLVAAGHPLHGPYHDLEYGFPVAGDDQLFERLILEINQAGLSWLTILKKRQAFRDAFHQFQIDRVAGYGEGDRKRLIKDAGIIRNARKIDAAIENAIRIQELQRSHGSFSGWLEAHHPLVPDQWQRLFKRTFLFTGGEITRSFLLSCGYLPGAHDEECPVFGTIARLEPAWMRNS
jgi:DNA-3-methyladenine glycosylase I